MKRNPATLAAIGQALYGPVWQKALSDALDVSDRTMRRWLKGEFIIPDGVWDELTAICQTRGAAIFHWASSLRKSF